MTDDLNPEEEQLLDQFRTRPTQGSIKVTNIWVVQWLPAEERQTGEELADWANQRRRGRTAFFRCNSKRDVIGAIDSAADHARSMDCSPILHIEAHGDENGIYGLGENGNEREIAWEELTEPFQNLNVATRCNLLVIVAACIGNAGVKSFVRGPRAPAIALIGPANNISPKSVLDATKELYRIIVNGHEHLDDIIAGMSSESGEVPFVDHRFTEICYEALVSELIKSARPDEKRKRRVIASERLAQRGYSSEQVTQILDSRPELGVAET